MPLNILAYHRVLPRWDDSHAGDLELISATTDDFRWQMQFVKKHFDVIGLHDLIRNLDGESPLPPRPIMVTFDDGFQDNFREALPVIEDLGLSATFFVSTGLVGKREPFWFDWVCQAVLETKADVIEEKVLGLRIDIPSNSDQRRSVAGQILQRLKGIPNQERRDALGRLVEALAIPMKVKHQNDQPMTWQQLQRIVDAGSFVESHAHEHAVLSSLEPTEIRKEIGTSVGLLKSKLKRPCVALSYPVGGSNSINESVLQSAADMGIRLGFTYISGVNNRSLARPLLLRRTHVERYIGRAEFATRMTLPKRFFVEK